MKSDKMQKTAQELFDLAGIKINSSNPWDIQIKNNQFFSRVLSGGSLALGESYMDGWWDVEQLDEFFNKVLGAQLDRKIKKNKKLILKLVLGKIMNFQGKSRAFNIGKKHYDIGNELYENMLDKRMVYTCGYWEGTDNLDQAQENKLDLVCRKIGLKEGDKVLDIGGGWGSFAKFAAEKYGARTTAITVSKEQQALGQKLCAGLPVEIRLQDYRDVNEKFDHIISLGMIEHVGPKNYREYMKIARKNLKEDGLFLLHTIGNRRSVQDCDAWIDKYIFPDGVLPSIAQLGKSFENLFVMEDWHSFGPHYDKTLMAWFNNFNNNWDKIKTNYDERFYLMWKYYLLACAGSFRARMNQLWQIVLSPNGVKGGYRSIR